jgi:hypothetical protein
MYMGKDSYSPQRTLRAQRKTNEGTKAEKKDTKAAVIK